MTAPSPVLIVGDAADASSGLGRILGELAERADAYLKDVCRIATLGHGGPGSRRFKFFQYHIEGMGADDWAIPNLPDVWKDWAGDEAGVILFIWDASRLGWFSRPEVMCQEPVLKSFLTSGKFQRWIYSPVDADGPRNSLTYPINQSLLGFNRILAYGKWAENVIRKSLGDEFSRQRDLTSIPHGIDPKVFYPRDRQASRRSFFSTTGASQLRGMVTGITGAQPLIGTVATNQTRKDWGLWAESCALFLERHPKTRFWIHTDKLERNWSIPALLIDFGLIDRTAISLGYLTNDQMAKAYSACDLTLGIGAGEGFGYPIAESLFCGTPVVHGKYAGAVDFTPDELLVSPRLDRHGKHVFHLEGGFACLRPVFDARDWVDKMEYLLERRMSGPSQLDWDNVWPRFEAWFRKGLA